MDVTAGTALLTLVMGTLSGSLGAMLGIGGGVFLVPFLILVVGLPFHQAAAVSLAAVVATSTAVSAATVGRQLINMRLGMVLEVATAAGGFAGGLTAQMLSPDSLQICFGVVALLVAVAVIRRGRPEPLHPETDTGLLGGRYVDERTGTTIKYAVHRLPAALTASFVAGNLSTLLGIGGGIMKVPLLNAFCGVPIRPAAATSAFMIGVTATSGAVIYFGRGGLVPIIAAAAVLGVRIGSGAGMRAGSAVPARRIKQLMAAVLVVVSALMFAEVR